MKILSTCFANLKRQMGFGELPPGYVLDCNDLGGWRWRKLSDKNDTGCMYFSRSAAVRDAFANQKMEEWARKYSAWKPHV